MVLCTACREDLPLTRFHDDPQNRVEQLFFGRARLSAASAFLLFNRSGIAQRMLHRLKYKGDLDVGIELGRMMAQDLAGSKRFTGIDALLAVPLHPSRQRQRGYNQSQVIVEGMQQIMGLPQLDEGLFRSVRTSSQTKRGRLARWMNVKEVFQVAEPEKLRDRHVLLVDDVVTTGATIESCALALQKVPGIHISVYTAACA